MTQPVQKQPGYYIQPGCECGLQTRDHWAASWNLGWMSKIRRKDVTFRTSSFVATSRFQGPQTSQTWTRTLRTHPRVATPQNTRRPKSVGRKDVTFRTRFCLSPRNHQKWRTDWKPKSGPKNYTSPRTHQKWRTGSKSQK